MKHNSIIAIALAAMSALYLCACGGKTTEQKALAVTERGAQDFIDYCMDHKQDLWDVRLSSHEGSTAMFIAETKNGQTGYFTAVRKTDKWTDEIDATVNATMEAAELILDDGLSDNVITGAQVKPQSVSLTLGDKTHAIPDNDLQLSDRLIPNIDSEDDFYGRYIRVLCCYGKFYEVEDRFSRTICLDSEKLFDSLNKNELEELSRWAGMHYPKFKGEIDAYLKDC